MMATLRQLLFIGFLVPLLASAVPTAKKVQQKLGEELPPCAQACLQNPNNCDPSCFADKCDEGSDLVTASASLGRACYYTVEPEPSTHVGYSFDQALANCLANNSDLASVHSDAENAFIFEELIKGSLGNGNHHYMWIGLELTRDPVAGIVLGAQWTDGSPVNYGNPVTNASKYPWASGQPEPGQVSEVGTHIYSFGKFRGEWDAYNKTPENAPYLPTNGYICKGCPSGWSYYEGHCYKAFVSNGSMVGLYSHFNQLCGLFNSSLVSIHSQAENNFVLNLARATGQNPAGVFIGMLVRRNPNTGQSFSPVTSQVWSDNPSHNLLPGEFGYVPPTGLPYGLPPWAAAVPGTMYLAQPDNNPFPGDITVMWVNTDQPGLWDDASSFSSTFPGAVCKFKL